MDTFCDRVHGIAEIHRWQDKSVNGHDQFQIAFMMKLIDSFLVNILIIILGMIIILHEGPGAEIIDCGWDTCDCHGEIIRPCLDGRENRDPVRICFLRDSQAVCKLSDEICIFIGTADGILSIVCVCRKFKVQVCDHFTLPVRMYAEYLIVGSCRPVVFGINDSPFLGSHCTEDKSVGRFIAALYQCTGNAEHHGDCRIIVLESIEIGIIVCGQQDHRVCLSPLYFTCDIACCCVRDHSGTGIQ